MRVGARRAWSLGLSCALLLAAVGARADPHQIRQGDITVSSRIVRASIPGSPNSAAYMVIANSGAQPEALIAARCACAAKVDVHKTEDMRGMSMMVSAAPVVIPPHGQVVFRPGGYHLMLTGLKEPLRDHGQQAITLVFKRAGAIRASFQISAQINLGTEAPMRGMTH
ncbi:MAG TPA: copper chaperone PCu(A)C [Caulobacteraceae bacterium]|nr:copper chaperone PCu(A)C [Caulobacteraceae bacterium]